MCLRYTIHLALGVFGGQSVNLHYCIGALVFFVCVLGYTIYLPTGVCGGKLSGLCFCIGALVFLSVCFGIHYIFSFVCVWWSISRLTLLYKGSCSFGVCLGYTIHLALGVFGT